MEKDGSKEKTRDMHIFHHGGGNEVNASGESNHGHGNFISRGYDDYGKFTPKRHNEVGNFSSYDKSYGHTSSDDYGDHDRDNAKYDYYEHSPYDCHEGVEYQGRSMKKELGNFLKDLLISPFLNHFLISYEVSLVELQLFLESYLSHVSIYGDLCVISFGGGLFLVVSYASTCLSSYAFLEESLLHSGSMFDLSCYDFKVIDNASIESTIVGFGLDGTLFDILHDKCLGKFIENVDYVSSFLDTFMENHNDFVFLNRLMSFMSGQVEFSFKEQKLSNVINSLNTLFKNVFGFQFYHLHFKELLLKDFENHIATNLESFKVNALAFEKSNSRKEAFEQVCKDFFVRHLLYHRPFKEWLLKLFVSFGSFLKNSCAFILKHEFEDTLFIHLIFLKSSSI
ncbi:hypothetical protein M9H77_03008 [Catharanthus roseus]|uniref:Uncharacterized protein n=1 Tax=Catharanthus roseus TaxID=4058 RepID=A0ACC0CA73_CATRO|nr:hypothetical protein M9H77_03008 [Catharanthus roseus]